MNKYSTIDYTITDVGDETSVHYSITLQDIDSGYNKHSMSSDTSSTTLISYNMYENNIVSCIPFNDNKTYSQTVYVYKGNADLTPKHDRIYYSTGSSDLDYNTVCLNLHLADNSHILDEEFYKNASYYTSLNEMFNTSLEETTCYNDEVKASISFDDWMQDYLFTNSSDKIKEILDCIMNSDKSRRNVFNSIKKNCKILKNEYSIPVEKFKTIRVVSDVYYNTLNKLDGMVFEEDILFDSLKTYNVSNICGKVINAYNLKLAEAEILDYSSFDSNSIISELREKILNEYMVSDAFKSKIVVKIIKSDGEATNCILSFSLKDKYINQLLFKNSKIDMSIQYTNSLLYDLLFCSLYVDDKKGNTSIFNYGCYNNNYAFLGLLNLPIKIISLSLVSLVSYGTKLYKIDTCDKCSIDYDSNTFDSINFNLTVTCCNLDEHTDISNLINVKYGICNANAKKYTSLEHDTNAVSKMYKVSDINSISNLLRKEIKCKINNSFIDKKNGNITVNSNLVVDGIEKLIFNTSENFLEIINNIKNRFCCIDYVENSEDADNVHSFNDEYTYSIASKYPHLAYTDEDVFNKLEVESNELANCNKIEKIFGK